MDKLLLFLCNLFSCFIIIFILFQFMNGNYERTYKNNYIYWAANAVSVFIFTGTNMLNNSMLNLLVWILIVGLFSFFLYYEENDKAGRRIIECEALALCMTVCEALGVILLQWVLQWQNVQIRDNVILHCLEVSFSKVILIFLYYMGISRFIRKRNFPLSKKQYSVYVVMLAYSVINMLFIVEEFMQKRMNHLWVANMCGIVLVDLYLLYYIKMSNEKNYFAYQVKVLRQQADTQYEYYLLQSEKYKSTLHILHDVDRHIKSIQDLYVAGKGKIAVEYVGQINDMLKPLIPVPYTKNPILDILLTDKSMYMKEKGIDFRVDIDNVDLRSIEYVDVTTIFGNLLDNAIEASEEAEGNKYVFLKIGTYHRMVSIRIENNSKYVRLKNGIPVSEKGPGRGIGIFNVKQSIAKYDGNIKMKWEDNKFTVEMFLNT